MKDFIKFILIFVLFAGVLYVFPNLYADGVPEKVTLERAMQHNKFFADLIHKYEKFQERDCHPIDFLVETENVRSGFEKLALSTGGNPEIYDYIVRYITDEIEPFLAKQKVCD